MKECSDRELLELIGDGDAAALGFLHSRWATLLAARLAIRSADPGLVEEAIQDTFVVVWRKADSYRGEGEVGAWLWGIAVRRLIDRQRKTRFPHLARPALVQSAEDVVLSGIGFGDLGAAMDRLSPELMAVVQARILDGLSTREAARLLGIPTGTVKTRLMKAMQIMREQMA